MQIVCTTLFEQQLKALLETMAQQDFQATKSFKIYLDTIILNMPTKAKKYKKSLYFDDEDIRDIDHQGFLIPFFIDKENDTYLLLGIVEK